MIAAGPAAIGQRKWQSRPASPARLCPQTPLMCFDDRPADGEANPETSELGTVERSEDAFGVVRIQARPGILNHNDNLAAAAIARSDLQLTWPFGTAAHRFNCISNQVQNDLLQLNAVGAQQWQPCRKLPVQANTVLHELCLAQGDDFIDRLVDLELILARGRLLNQRADPADDVVDAMAKSGDARQCLPDLLDIGLMAIQKAQGGLRVGYRRRDWLVDFVGNRGRHLSEGRDAVRVCQLHLCLVIASLAVAQIRLRLLALAQIEHESDPFFPSLFEARGTDQHGHAAAVLAKIFLLERWPNPRPLEIR